MQACGSLESVVLGAACALVRRLRAGLQKISATEQSGIARSGDQSASGGIRRRTWKKDISLETHHSDRIGPLLFARRARCLCRGQDGEKDPAEIIDIWLFKDDVSYAKNVKKIFNETPVSPFGYYSSE